MLDLNVRAFLLAVTELRQLQILIDAICTSADSVHDEDRGTIAAHLVTMTDAIRSMGAFSALRVAEALRRQLDDATQDIDCATISSALYGLERRFADHLRYCTVARP